MSNSAPPNQCRFRLKIIEVLNKALLFFLISALHPGSGRAAYDTSRVFEFDTEDDAHFKLGLGVDENYEYAYISLDFEHPLKVDLTIFDETTMPDIERGNFTLWSPEARAILDSQESQRKKATEEIRSLFPLVARAVNRFNEACRLTLYQDAINYDFVAHDLETSGVRFTVLPQGDPVGKEPDDAVSLFAAFPSRGAVRLAQEVDIKYRVEDNSGRVIDGFIRNSRRLVSPGRFGKYLDNIQKRLCDHWTVQDGVLLAAVEYLYGDNYRMAVFNAVTVLELVVTGFYESLASESDAKRQKLKRDAENYKNKHKVPLWLAKLKITLPKYLCEKFDRSGNLDHCLEAWYYRDKTVAHLITSERDRILSQHEAWSMIVSIMKAIDDIRQLETSYGNAQ